MSSSSPSTSTFLPDPLREIAQEVSTLLKDRKETISVAETAAGGLISASLLSQPGASTFYRGGLTLYTLESRLAFAGWTDADTSSYTGPTPSIVLKLATNTRVTLGSTYCVSESGTAGPTGGSTRNRTPGYVALAVVGPAGNEGEGGKGEWTKEVETGSSDREGNMVRFAVEGLRLVRQAVLGGSLEDKQELMERQRGEDERWGWVKEDDRVGKL